MSSTVGGVVANTYAAATAHKVRGKMDGSWISDYIGTKTSAPEPHGFLVEGDPGYTIKPHFHGVDQFQVCVAGRGTLGKQELVPGVLHYADAYTPYGPIVAGDAGLSFFTLRKVAYPDGAHFVPGSKDKKKGPSGRNVVTAVDPARERSNTVRHLIAEPDGVRAVEIPAAPGARLPDPDGFGDRGGAYILVFAGAIAAAGAVYARHSLMWVPARTPAPAMTAQGEGAVVGVLCFAAPTA